MSQIINNGPKNRPYCLFCDFRVRMFAGESHVETPYNIATLKRFFKSLLVVSKPTKAELLGPKTTVI